MQATIRTVMLFSLLCNVMGCVVRSEVQLSNQALPTFLVTGQQRDFFFSVKEVAPANYGRTPGNNDPELNEFLWEVRPTAEPSVKGTLNGVTTAIVYGQVPAGFSQTFPQQGRPPRALQEGRIYEANGGSACCENTPATLWFKVEQGKLVLFKQ